MEAILQYFKSTFTVGWLVGLVISLLFIGVLYLLGKTGQIVRRGVEIKKMLRKAKLDAATNGLQIDGGRYRKYDRKATFFISVPVLGWSTTCTYLAVILPVKVLTWLLVFLIVPLLGYFGIFFVPSDDGSDYVPHG